MYFIVHEHTTADEDDDRDTDRTQKEVYWALMCSVVVNNQPLMRVQLTNDADLLHEVTTRYDDRYTPGILTSITSKQLHPSSIAH
jgi:hypothetical protein